MLRKTVAVVFALVLTGCGSRPPAAADRQWRANARGVAQQLRQDVVAVSSFDRGPLARAGLRNDSQLYGLLVSHTDFGGCAHMVAALGDAPPSLEPARRLLATGCARLRVADGFFTRAVARDEPQLLVRATLAAQQALAPLERAELALRASA